MSNLNEKAMLATLNISQFSARKCDKQATREVIANKHATKDAARVHKALVAKEALKEIQSVASEARQLFYEKTLAWNDDGTRLLPASIYLDTVTKIRELKTKFDNNVSKFMDNYDNHVEDAKQMLGDMFNSQDYPTKEQLYGKYDFKFEVFPMPDASDFRVKLNAEEINVIKKEIESTVQERLNRGVADMQERLFETVNRIAETLSEPDKIFRDSLIANVVDLTKTLKDLNVVKNPKVEELRKKVEDTLCQYKPDDLRDSKVTRLTAAKEANDILGEMATLFK